MKRAAYLVAALALSTSAHSARALDIVFDPQAYARQFEELQELTKQLDTMKEQLSQAKALYDSMNQLTNVNDIAGLLNSDEFRSYLPAEFSEIEGLIDGSGSGFAGLTDSIDGYLDQNRHYESEANNFYAQELDRIARQTGAKHSIGEAVYETASQRIDQLEQLRERVSTAGTAKEVMDLSARLQAEQALLQNEVLRMQGLAMMQQARADMDAQRAAERKQQTADEMMEALQ